MLIEGGPELGRPLVDRIHHSRLSNLKELQPGSAGRSEIRILYVFDPKRNAVLLVAGDKAGQWESWYRSAIAAGMERLRAEQRAYRLAELRRRLGFSQAQVADRMGVTQGRVSAIENAMPGATELRTIAAYVEALGGRLEVIADFGDQRLAFAEPGTEAA
jgi:hypothetical protein